MSTARILVVDDEADIRELVQDILSEEGYVVDVAENAVAARAACARSAPDLVLLDIWMPDTDGISLLPTLTGSGKQAEHDYLYWEFYEQGGKQAIRQGDWKLVRAGLGEGATELYDLATDPAESRSVLSEHPEIARDLEEKITTIVCNGRTTPGPRQPNDTGYWNDLSWIKPSQYHSATRR